MDIIIDIVLSNGDDERIYLCKASDEKIKIELTKEEIEDVLENLDQCLSEGYIEYGDGAFFAYQKLMDAINENN